MPNPGVADGNRCYRPPMVELGTHSVTERAEVGNSPPTGLCILGAPRLLDRMIPALQPTTRALSGLTLLATSSASGSGRIILKWNLWAEARLVDSIRPHLK